MKIEEIVDIAKVVKMLMQLPEEKQIEFYFMIKGAALVAEKR